MSVLFILIPLSIVIAAGFLAAFIWAVRSGQYEDTCTPSMRVLFDDAGLDAPAGVKRTAAHGPPGAGNCLPKTQDHKRP
jgi:cbb3-type cytochrome oxidase maturation protein